MVLQSRVAECLICILLFELSVVNVNNGCFPHLFFKHIICVPKCILYISMFQSISTSVVLSIVHLPEMTAFFYCLIFFCYFLKNSKMQRDSVDSILTHISTHTTIIMPESNVLCSKSMLARYRILPNGSTMLMVVSRCEVSIVSHCVSVGERMHSMFSKQERDLKHTYCFPRRSYHTVVHDEIPLVNMISLEVCSTLSL